MRKRKNFAPPLGPDACVCGSLAQMTLSITEPTARWLGFHPEPGEVLSLRVCLGCYLLGMNEAQARARAIQPVTGKSLQTTPPSK